MSSARMSVTSHAADGGRAPHRGRRQASRFQRSEGRASQPVPHVTHHVCRGRTSASRFSASYGFGGALSLFAYQPQDGASHRGNERPDGSPVALEAASSFVIGAPHAYVGDQHGRAASVGEHCEPPGSDGITRAAEVAKLLCAPFHPAIISIPPSSDESEHQFLTSLLGQQMKAALLFEQLVETEMLRLCNRAVFTRSDDGIEPSAEPVWNSDHRRSEEVHPPDSRECGD